MASPAKINEKSGAPRRRVKVGVLGLRGFPNVMGGVESHCAQLYPRLSRMGGRTYIVLARKPYRVARERLDDNLEVRPFWAVRNKYLEAALHTLFGVMFLSLVENPDLIHIHAVGPALFTPLAKLFGKKVVVTHHGRDYERQKWNGFAKWVLRMGERMAIMFADRVIVVAPSVANALAKGNPSRAPRIVHIPNGATQLPKTDPDPAATLARFGLRPKGYILSVGRLVPSKGFGDLIAAYRKSNLDMKLCIAGGTEFADAFSKRLLMEADGRVVMTGAQRPDVLQTLYANASLFVLASHYEGLPLVVLEAIAAGAPVVVSDIQANLDLNLPALHYFPVGDTDALARMLQTPHEDFQVAAASIGEAYEWDNIAVRTEEVYRQALAARA